MSARRVQDNTGVDTGVGQREYFDRLFNTADPSHHFPLLPGVQVQEWQVDLRDILNALLGLHTMPQVPLNPRVLKTAKEDDYLVEHVQYQSEPGVFVPALYFRPLTDRGDGQAVLALHGDGAGIDDPKYPYIREFARRGYYVLAPELRDFGKRRDAGIAGEQSRDILGLFGKNLLGLRVLECLRSLDYLLAQREVNARYVGVCGMDLGAQLALLVAALDQRVACCGMSGFMSTYRDLCYTNHNPGWFVIPNVMHYCDVSDIAGLVAPRPLIIEAAEGDNSVTYRETLRAVNDVRRIYEAMGHPDLVELSSFPGELRFNGLEIYAWFSRHLAPAQ